MNCTRCHDFMMKERLYDLLENDGQYGEGALRDTRIGKLQKNLMCS